MRIVIFIILALILARCNKPDAPDCFQTKGDTVTETVEVNEPFHSIILYDNIQLVLTNDSTSGDFIEIRGAENLLSDLEFSVSGGTLKVENLNTCNWVRSYNDFELLINRSGIDHVFNYGAQGVEISYSASSLVVEQENSLADNLIHFTGDSLTVNIHTSSGSALVTGSAQYGQLYCNGFSSMSTDGFEVNRVLANNSGSGSMYVTPSEFLFAFIGGSGNIVYSNGAVELTTQIQGSGQVILSDN